MICSHTSAFGVSDLYEAYKCAIKASCYGNRVITEDADDTSECKYPVSIVVYNPDNKDGIKDLRECCPYGDGYLNQYINDFLNGVSDDDERPMDFEYTYHERLWKYDLPPVYSPTINQISAICNKLKTSQLSRRAVAITWQPWNDIDSHDPPCLNHIQFWIREDRLNCATLWRSRDMLKGFPANVLAVNAMHTRLAQELHVKMGYYSDTTNIPHAYLPKDRGYLFNVNCKMNDIDLIRQIGGIR